MTYTSLHETKESGNFQKYALMRMNFLIKRRKSEYDKMCVLGVLDEHLEHIQQMSEDRFDEIMKYLMRQNPYSSSQKGGHEDYIKQLSCKADEVIMLELIYN